MDGQDGQDKRETMSDECGVMNDEKCAVFHSSLIIPHSSLLLILPILSIPVKFFVVRVLGGIYHSTEE
jgi:hypothetical protein